MVTNKKANKITTAPIGLILNIIYPPTLDQPHHPHPNIRKGDESGTLKGLLEKSFCPDEKSFLPANNTNKN
jgi:hypothetical protein